jgi:hypothetical protein
MGDWSPAKIREVHGRRVFLWMVPDNSTELPSTAGMAK